MADAFQIIPPTIRAEGKDVPPEQIQAGFNSLARQTQIGLNSVATDPTGPASGDLGGMYPAPTVVAVHAIGGTLDGVAIGGTTPSTGAFTTLTATAPVAVTSGGTGGNALSAHNVLIGEGSSAIGFAAPGTAGKMLISGGAAVDPAFANNPVITGGTIDGAPIGQTTPAAGNFTTLAASTAVTVPSGGTGRATLTAHGVLLGEGTAAVNQTAAGTTGQMLLGVTGADPAFGNNPTITGGTIDNAVIGGTTPVAATVTSLRIPSTGTGISQTFIGSGGAALMWENQTAVAANATTPEIGAQFTINSNVGTANKTTAFKIGLTSSAIGGASSANVYGMNTITQGFGGTYLVTGIESDVNNVGADAITVGAATAVYGLVAVAAGSFKSTAGLWLTNGGSGSWTYGAAVSQANVASYYDASSATYGMDMRASSHTWTLALPNNVSLGQNDSGATLRTVVYIDNTNVLHIGEPALAGVTVFPNFTATGFIKPSTTNGIVGTTLADNANAGSVGEYATNTTTGTSLSTGVTANATSVSLTAGDWDVTGMVRFVPAGSTTITNYYFGVSTTSATLGALGSFGQDSNSFQTGTQSYIQCPTFRVNVSTTTTVYIVAQATFAASTMTCDGFVRARRVR